MEIGLYFGSFNPIHHGHLIIASHIINQTSVKQVWFVVSPQNPFKPAASLLNEHHRLHLVQCAINEVPEFRASNVEFKLPKPSYTIDTLTYLQEKYPMHKFLVIMGSDSFQNIGKWKNAETLLKNWPILIYKRPGFEIKEALPESISILEAPLLQISSTGIRKLIKEQKNIKFLVPDVVKNEIEQNNYYK